MAAGAGLAGTSLKSCDGCKEACIETEVLFGPIAHSSWPQKPLEQVGAKF